MALDITMPMKRKSFKSLSNCQNSEIRVYSQKYKPKSNRILIPTRSSLEYDILSSVSYIQMILKGDHDMIK